MHLLKTLIVLLISISCTSVDSKDWSSWIMVDVPSKEREWEFCREDLHGPDFHQKGFCWIAEECRYRKTIFNNTKNECRPITLFCKWGDIECLYKYDIFSMKIKH